MSRTSFLKSKLYSTNLAASALRDLGFDRGIRTRQFREGTADADAEEMGPDDVGDVAGDPRVVGSRQPLGDRLAAGAAGEVRVRAAEEFRGGVLFGDGVLEFAVPIEHDAFAGVLGGFAFHLGEKRCEAVIIAHRPAIEGMVVALRALDAGAHEHLRHVLGELEDVFLDLIVVGGRVGEGAALGGQQFADELVERGVGGDALAEPLVVVESGFVGHLLRTVVEGADLHQLRPFHHPHLGELLAAEQLVHKLGALVRTRVG